MAYPQKIILHSPPWDSPLLDGFVEACVRDKVALVCVVGHDCERVRDVIDELIAGDGSSERESGPVTSWHKNETLAEVWNFARQWKVDGDASGPVAEVVLGA